MFTRKAITVAAGVMMTAGLAHAVDTDFTYQGVLQDSGLPANGQYDILFQLYTASSGGTFLGSSVESDVPVTDGRFAVNLDFGPDFYDGEERWLRIFVRPGASVGSYTELTPRQEVTATPHSQHAETSDLVQTAFDNGVLGIETFTNTEAGEMKIRLADGTLITDFGPDQSTPSGGEMKLYNNTGALTVYLDADIDATGNGYMSLSGDVGSAFFDMDFSGVLLPSDSIQSFEMSNETGVASLATNSGATISSNTTHTTIATRTINCPAPGYVMAIATCQAGAFHSNGTTSNYDFGVSDEPDSFPANQEVAWVTPSSAATGSYFAPVTVHGLFEVSTGANQFYFLGRKISSAAPNGNTNDPQLTLVYIPTSYGTVAPTLLGGGGSDANAPQTLGWTPEQMAAEREASIADYQAQVDAELAAIREEVALLRSMREGAEQPQAAGEQDTTVD